MFWWFYTGCTNDIRSIFVVASSIFSKVKQVLCLLRCYVFLHEEVLQSISILLICKSISLLFS